MSTDHDVIVVALVYNANGMAAWCWEAAHALCELGHPTVLVATRSVSLPGVPAMEVLRIEEPTPITSTSGLRRTISGLKGRVDAKPDGLLRQIEGRLVERGIRPIAYVLNQSTLVDPAIVSRQVVAGWSYPTSALGYLRKVPKLVGKRDLKHLVTTALSTLGWWRRDWRAYRAASRVLSVSGNLCRSLERQSVKCDLAYPGTLIGAMGQRPRSEIRVFMAALRLGEPRKRIAWMLEATKEMLANQDVVIQLAGISDDNTRRAASRSAFQVEFLGHLSRADLQSAMQKAHIFCFGSLLDDWGYVLVEAMANGLVPVAPAIPPFNEILGPTGSCYSAHDPIDFRRALGEATHKVIVGEGNASWNRASALFSRRAFGNSIVQSLDKCLVE